MGKRNLKMFSSRMITDFPDQVVYNGFDGLADMFPTVSNDIKRLNTRCYQIMRRTDAIAQPMNKVAKRIGMMNVVIEGKGKRAEMLQKIIDRTLGMSGALQFLAWAKVEGTRFQWMRARQSGDFFIGDLRNDGRMKESAGGLYRWDGRGPGHDRVMKIKQYGGFGAASEGDRKRYEAKMLPRERVVVFTTGNGIDPEGDTDLGWQLYLIAEAADLLDKAMRIYSDRHALPMRVMKKLLDNLRPDEVATVQAAVTAKIAGANARQVMGMNIQDMFELIEPTGTTWEFLTEYRAILERRAMKAIADETMTSDTGEAGPVGSSKTAERMLDDAALFLSKQISDALTTDFLPWIEKINAHVLPQLADDEEPPRIVLRSAIARQRTNIPELIQLVQNQIPLNTDFVYEVIGCERPEGMPDVFVGKARPMGINAPMLNEEGNPERPDRPLQSEQEQPIRKRGDMEDLRNLKKDKENEQ